MSTYYLDSSALSKRYVQEMGTEWIRSLTSPDADHLLLTARITMVEFYSALARRHREGTVPTADYATVIQAFTAHSATEYEYVELDLKVVFLARDLLERYPLRAYDAVQLASSLVANRALVASNLPPLTFVSADERLNAAAAAEDLAIENPNQYY